MGITVGPSSIVVTALGRIFAPGNSQTHVLKIVNAGTGADVPASTVTVNMAGGTAGAFVYGALPTPITLSANSSYYFLSQETVGGDQWYDANTIVQSTSLGTVNYPVYGGPPYAIGGTSNHSYVPVDFRTACVTVSVSPGTAALAASQTQQFTAAVNNTGNAAVSWAITPATGSISATGLYTAPLSVSTTQTVTVTATSAADNTKSASATVTLNPLSP
jgi:hypothetical protein